MSRVLPLIRHYDRCLAHYRGRAVSVAEFLGAARALADALPDHRYVFNLSEDRYHFMLGLAAAMLRGQVTLMPPNRIAGTINSLAEHYADAYSLSEKVLPGVNLPCHPLKVSEAPEAHIVPAIDADSLVAVAFTSGSTGEPQANLKYWEDLVRGAALARDRFGFDDKPGGTLVATVPPQHMYGLETSILSAWQTRLAVCHGRPFFPADVRDTLAAVPGPAVLVTTPVHLRACLAADLDWPEIDGVISATAPLSVSLAAEVEKGMRTTVKEIYGSTESGAVASRRTVESASWRLYDSLSLADRGGLFFVDGGHLREPTLLSDQLGIEDVRHFKLLGRNADMIKIAGKRASLSELNLRLAEIDGVEDSVIFMPQASGDNQRLNALVVAPGLEEAFILGELANSIDPVFLPRPLFLVKTLPRNETGKLPRKILLAFLERLKGTGIAGNKVVE